MAGNITELKRDEMTLVTEVKKEIQVRNFHLTFSTNYYTQTKEGFRPAEIEASEKCSEQKEYGCRNTENSDNDCLDSATGGSLTEARMFTM